MKQKSIINVVMKHLPWPQFHYERKKLPNMIYYQDLVLKCFGNI